MYFLSYILCGQLFKLISILFELAVGYKGDVAHNTTKKVDQYIEFYVLIVEVILTNNET